MDFACKSDPYYVSALEKERLWQKYCGDTPYRGTSPPVYFSDDRDYIPYRAPSLTSRHGQTARPGGHFRSASEPNPSKRSSTSKSYGGDLRHQALTGTLESGGTRSIGALPGAFASSSSLLYSSSPSSSYYNSESYYRPYLAPEGSSLQAYPSDGYIPSRRAPPPPPRSNYYSSSMSSRYPSTLASRSNTYPNPRTTIPDYDDRHFSCPDCSRRALMGDYTLCSHCYTKLEFQMS